jgi:toxin-antitoxin system PIN domain toxin
VTDTLPDVNLLLVLAWPNHQFFARARRWFNDRSARWCTCAVTQLGFVRLSSNPSYTEHAKSPLEAVRLLAAMTAHPEHRFLSEHPPIDDASFADVASRLMGHQQVTDAYLVAFARHHDVQLVTFDRRIEAISPADGLVVRLEA